MNMTNLNQTLREMSTPVVDHQPLCNLYDDTSNALELKFGMIHLLSNF